MIEAKTLVGLACLISNQGSVDIPGVHVDMSDVEKNHVITMVHAKPCLPENFEILLKETQYKIREGLLRDISSKGEPCDFCAAN